MCCFTGLSLQGPQDVVPQPSQGPPQGPPQAPHQGQNRHPHPPPSWAPWTGAGPTPGTESGHIPGILQALRPTPTSWVLPIAYTYSRYKIKTTPCIE